MNEHLYGVIMAGGIGSRLWPRSRSDSPKQFLDLLGSHTMLQQTVGRIEPLIPLARLLVVVSGDHVETVRAQVPDLPRENLIVEPGPRGTAPCIGLAAVALQQRDPAATMAIFPSDHRIADEGALRQAIAAAATIAQDEFLVTLGITPSHPHTGLGYIQRGRSLGRVQGLPAFQVQRFTEKPDDITAQRFVDSGEYYWNAGIFVWRAATILVAMECLLPHLHTELAAIGQAWDSPQHAELLETAWSGLDQTTIDYGIMEKAKRVAVLPVDIGWDDVGNWAALSGLLQDDGSGNIIRGKGHPLLLDTANTYVYASAGRLVAVLGLDGFVVVDTPDALLICPKDQAEAVRDVVAQLGTRGLQQYL